MAQSLKYTAIYSVTRHPDSEVCVLYVHVLCMHVCVRQLYYCGVSDGVAVILPKAAGVLVSALGFTSPMDPMAALYCVTSSSCLAFVPEDREREKLKIVSLEPSKVWCGGEGWGGEMCVDMM